MKRTAELQRAGTPSAKSSGQSKGNKPWREGEPTHTVRSLACVGGRRPNAFAKRRKKMANKAGFPTFAAWMDALSRKPRA